MFTRLKAIFTGAVCCLGFSPLLAEPISTEQFKETVRANYNQIQTGHITFLEQRTSSIPAHVQAEIDKGKKNPIVAQLNQNQEYRSEVFFDFQSEQARVNRTDLRDINQLIEENSLPAFEVLNLSVSDSKLNGRDYMLSSKLADNPKQAGNPAWLLINDNPVHSFANQKADYACGNIVPSLLDLGSNLRLEEDRWKGRPVLKLQVDLDGGPVIAMLDPALGYRYLRYEGWRDGKLVLEKEANDYRTIGGIPYPHHQLKRVYDKTGQVSEETVRTVQDAALNVALDPSVFELELPAETQVVDMKKVFHLKQRMIVTLENCGNLFELMEAYKGTPAVPRAGMNIDQDVTALLPAPAKAPASQAAPVQTRPAVSVAEAGTPAKTPAAAPSNRTTAIIAGGGLALLMLIILVSKVVRRGQQTTGRAE